MTIDDIQTNLQMVAKTVEATQPIWRDLPGLVRRWRTPKQDGVPDRRDHVRDLLRDNALDTLGSLELTMEAVFHILGPDFESEDAMDPTWQKRWIGGATNVAADDEKRRTWWSQLLAGEIQNPGSYSLRTLSIMDTLSPTEAYLFGKLCSCVWRIRGEHPVLIMPGADNGEIWRMTEQQASRLEEAGLVSFHSLGYELKLTKGKPERFQNGHLDLFVVPTEDKVWRISAIALTTPGREILNLVEVVPDVAHHRAILAELKKQAEVYYAIRTEKSWIAGNRVVD